MATIICIKTREVLADYPTIKELPKYPDDATFRAFKAFLEENDAG